MNRSRLVAELNSVADDIRLAYGFTDQTGTAQVEVRKPGQSKRDHLWRIVMYGRWQAMLDMAQRVADHEIKG